MRQRERSFGEPWGDQDSIQPAWTPVSSPGLVPLQMGTWRPKGQGPQIHTTKSGRGCWVPPDPSSGAEPLSVALGPPGVPCRVTVSGQNTPHTHTYTHTGARASDTQPSQPQGMHMGALSPRTHPAATLAGHTRKDMRAHIPTQSSGFDTHASTYHTHTHTCICTSTQMCKPLAGLSWLPGQPG